jgi:CRP-like cAMP-binding protein
MATRVKTGDWAIVLEQVPLFAGLSKRHLKKIAGLASTKHYVRYEDIVRRGDAGDAFYVVLDGSVAVKRPGKRSVTLGQGASFGELALLDDAPRNATVEAQEDVTAIVLGRSAFLKMLQNEPKVAVSLLRTLARMLHESTS